jgi:formate hydrogenlyase transcriptional activator
LETIFSETAIHRWEVNLVNLDCLIGSSKAFRNVLDDIQIIAPLDCAVLIQGETGTGKEVVARAIHENGPRRNRPFVAINCAAIPASLLESELFGHEKGAFTGAINQTVGRFHAANGGTLFLDEIGDLPLELQPKLLRVLQEQQFERLGSTRSMHVDVRIVAATNLHLQEMVNDKKFRADLYYRLNVFTMMLPALRARKEDIPVLIQHFLERFGSRLGKQIDHVPGQLLERMMEHDWPGNIRELQNFIERAMITSPNNTLCPRAIELQNLFSAGNRSNPITLADAERAHIERILLESNGILSGRGGAAARLGLPRSTLISRMQRLGITKPTTREPSGTTFTGSSFPGTSGRPFVIDGEGCHEQSSATVSCSS